MNRKAMDGARILHLEDEILIAMEVESICCDHGAASVTNIRDLDEAARTDLALFDVAVIDLTVKGQSSMPFAERVHDAGIPMIFVTGHDRESIAGRFPAADFINKPFRSQGVVDAIDRAFARRGSGST